MLPDHLIADGVNNNIQLFLTAKTSTADESNDARMLTVAAELQLDVHCSFQSFGKAPAYLPAV